MIATSFFPPPTLHTAPGYAQSHTLGQTRVSVWLLVSDTADCEDWVVFLIHLLQVSVRISYLELLACLYSTQGLTPDYEK